ncbi:hypothetical protein BN940_17846 [Castellaniella defragrans 65Phen]|uniref:Uncharacterized protein n=1 Tax=Castellaniella defragrans (strain DSM 12143 / CCUG 39792 / 65Phen) TaxID=1437824 RepID=W8XA58_CASD6|nr:hypothetical protein BN940_17846 [Castellaniella defragrans 65Phen]
MFQGVASRAAHARSGDGWAMGPAEIILVKIGRRCRAGRGVPGGAARAGRQTKRPC